MLWRRHYKYRNVVKYIGEGSEIPVIHVFLENKRFRSLSMQSCIGTDIVTLGMSIDIQIYHWGDVKDG